MTKTTHPQPARVILSDPTMQAIEALCRTTSPPLVKLNGVLLIVLGACWLEAHDGPVDPTQFEIPAAQWKNVGHLLAQATKTVPREESVNLLLDWMNLGPSAYEED